MAGFKRVVLTETDQNIETQNNTAQKQMEKFDNSYSSKKLNDLYKEFDAITFQSPSISSNTLVKENAYVEQKQALSFKTKLYLTSAILITLLLAFLAIYNIFVINSLDSGIKILQEEVTISESDYKTLYDTYNQLRNATNITERASEEGFSLVSSNSVVTVPLIETQNVSPLNYESNWFNDFCNFLGELFGG